MFLLVSQLLGGTLIVQEWPTRSGVFSFVLTAPLLIMLLVPIISIPMYLAWRLAGAPREYQRVLVILVYQCSFAGIALSLSTFVMLVGIELTAPTALDQLARTPRFEEVGILLKTLQAAPGKSPWVVAALIMYAIGLGTMIWLAMAWRSYGDVLDRRGLPSIAALALFALFLGIPLSVLIWAATLVS
jgi:hypothetical protein